MLYAVRTTIIVDVDQKAVSQTATRDAGCIGCEAAGAIVDIQCLV